MTTVYIWGALNLTGHASVQIEKGYLSFHPHHSVADKPDAVKENLLTLNPLSLDLPKKPDAVKEVLSNLSRMGRNIIDDINPSQLGGQLHGCPAMLASLEWDKKKGNGITASVDINWLNEAAMQLELNSIGTKITTPDLKYNLLVSNCSTLCAELLVKGAGANFSLTHISNAIRNEITRSKLRYDNPRVIELLRAMTEDAAFMCLRRGKNLPARELMYKVILTTGLITRGVWTPGDVKVLAEELAHQNH